MAIWLRLLIISFLATLVACVGTIEDTNLEKTKTAETNQSKFPFGGLIDAKAVSDSKVEIYFLPAPGEPKDITYQIFVNGSDTPIFVTGSSLTPNPRGQLVFTVTGLQVNTSYGFAVSAINSATGAISDEGDERYAKTFANITADFSGISAVKLPAGISAQNSVIVEWVPAVSKGSTFSPKTADPIAYEITYISEDGGATNLNNTNYTGGDRFISTNPSPIPASPQLSGERTRIISGLTSGKEYFFQVRAIHKGYNDFGGPSKDPNYRREENNRFLSIMTATPTGTFNFDETGSADPADDYRAISPDGEDALDSIDIIWPAATGDFDHYRLFFAAVSSTTDPDALTTSDINTLDDNPANYKSISANDTFYRLTNLNAYRPYQMKLVVCGTSACAEGDRIEGTLLSHATHPKIAPFDGIKTIDNPRSISDAVANRIYLNFNAPVVNTGYITDMELFCVNDPNDFNSGIPEDLLPSGEGITSTDKIVRMDVGISVTTAGALPNCDGIRRDTVDPTSTSGFSTFTEIEITGAQEDVGKQYCFMLVPKIDGDNTYEFNDVEDIANGIIKCIVPASQPPTIAQFPGKDQNCTVIDRSLKVDWNLPTAGMYTNFEVFWREDIGLPFKYSEAISEIQDGMSDDFSPPYDSNAISPTTVLGSSDQTYTIDNLVPGRRYFSGVLSYFVDGSKRYSEYNLNTSSCVIPLPTAEWDEWTEIFAVGPKIDGMVPFEPLGGGSGRTTALLETLDSDGTPIEVLTHFGNDEVRFTNDLNESIHNVNDNANSGYYVDLNATEFDGVYGASEGDLANPLRQFSNRGIVRIAWKDITFYSGTLSLNDIRGIYENPDPGKNNRRFGYKVLRSDNNRLSWVDLTSTAHPYQISTNAGLVVASPKSWKKRANSPTLTEDMVTFTDYSVQSYMDNRTTDYGKVLWYKIVPHFDGTPLDVANDANVIKVVLPPPNMSLVNRLMANRMICNEMDKSINKDPGKYYTCDYNGVGAKGLTSPWETGSTVYDFGGDLLVDRFEMGCNVTRGEAAETADTDSIYTGPYTSFQGQSDDAPAKFVGCAGDSGWDPGDLESMEGTFPVNTDITYQSWSERNWRRTRSGDCWGYGSISLADYGGGATPVECQNDATKTKVQFLWPGAHGNTRSCDTDTRNSYWGDNDGTNVWGDADGYNFYENQVQSEFAAVYYHRTPSVGAYSQQRWPSTNLPSPNNGDIYNTGSYRYPSFCFINLPGIEDGRGGAWTARWFPLNRLFDNELSQDGVTFTLYDKTLDEVLADPKLYNNAGATEFAAPASGFIDNDRYERNATPIARIITSNNSKLPPISLISQKDMNNLCGLYNVDIGITDPSDGSFVSLLQSPLKKRIARKAETVVMGAWPDSWDSDDIQEMESGATVVASQKFTFNRPRLQKIGSTVVTGNNSTCNVNGKSIVANGQGDATTDTLVSTLFPFHTYDNVEWMITGSSSLDFDGVDYNTEKCVSRWGIQDLVGNAGEFTSDEIFCDFSGEKMWYGTSAVQSASINATDHGFVGNYINSTLVAHAVSGTNTGRCSVVEPGADRGAYTLGSQFLSIFDSGGGYDPAIIKQTKSLDQEGVLTMRNGDGFFMDFGQGRLGPAMANDNVMGLGPTGLTPENNTAHYFNPATGLPLFCGGGICATSDDNTRITTDEQLTQFSLTPGNFDIPDFPIGNSQIYNEGLRKISTGSSFSTPTNDGNTYRFLETIDRGASDFLEDDIINTLPRCANSNGTCSGEAGGAPFSTNSTDCLDPGVNGGTGTWVARGDAGCFYGGAVFTENPSGGTGWAGPTAKTGTYYSWTIPRNGPLQFIVGGRKTDSKAGRYHFRIIGRSQSTLRRTFGYGGRCVVMIGNDN